MKKAWIEVIVGFFVLIGIAVLVFLAIRLGRVKVIGGDNYTITADFSSATGLSVGSDVEIAGVGIGKVKSIALNKDYDATVTMQIKKGIEIQEDAIASIRTRGIIGDQYLKISLGASEKLLKNGGKIRETEPPLDIQELVGKFMFDKKKGGKNGDSGDKTEDF